MIGKKTILLALLVTLALQQLRAARSLEQLAILKALNKRFSSQCFLLGALRKACFFPGGTVCRSPAECKVILQNWSFKDRRRPNAWLVIKNDLPADIQ